MHDVVVDSVFNVRCAIVAANELSGLRVSLGEEKVRLSFAEEPALYVGLVIDLDYSRSRDAVFLENAELLDGAQRRAIVVSAPRPCVAEPNGRKKREVCFGWTSVGCGDLDQDVFGARLGVLGGDVEIAGFGEGPRVQQLILAIRAIPAAAFFRACSRWTITPRSTGQRPSVRLSMW